MEAAALCEQTKILAIPTGTRTAGAIHNHNHHYVVIPQPPDQGELQLASRRGVLSALTVLNSETAVSICGYVTGFGLATGIHTDDSVKMAGCFSVAALGAVGVLYATYAACKQIAGCTSVCGEALKLTGLGAMVAAISFFVHYS